MLIKSVITLKSSEKLSYFLICGIWGSIQTAYGTEIRVYNVVDWDPDKTSVWLSTNIHQLQY